MGQQKKSSTFKVRVILVAMSKLNIKTKGDVYLLYSNGGSNPSNSEKVGKTQTNIDNSDMSNTKKLTEEPEGILDIVGMETGSFPLQQDTSGKLIPIGFKIASTDSLNKISYSALA